MSILDVFCLSLDGAADRPMRVVRLASDMVVAFDGGDLRSVASQDADPDSILLHIRKKADAFARFNFLDGGWNCEERTKNLAVDFLDLGAVVIFHKKRGTAALPSWYTELRQGYPASRLFDAVAALEGGEAPRAPTRSDRALSPEVSSSLRTMGLLAWVLATVSLIALGSAAILALLTYSGVRRIDQRLADAHDAVVATRTPACPSPAPTDSTESNASTQQPNQPSLVDPTPDQGEDLTDHAERPRGSKRDRARAASPSAEPGEGSDLEQGRAKHAPGRDVEE